MFCRSPPTTSNINENNTRHNATIVAAEESSGLPLWAILPFVVLAFLAVVCFVILLIATRIRGFASVRFFRKTAHEPENGLS
ncbi:unnamed protein product, partial [Mesorhabditis belari]|uniref:Uncharacterized protein n=1 Tax=Mesorhabditis belari TaxID=2138241 RepID=A0AAF3J370_9BILA